MRLCGLNQHETLLAAPRPLCSCCKKPVTRNPTSLDDEIYHPECFKCCQTRCTKPVQYTKATRLYCYEHYTSKCQPQCRGCRKVRITHVDMLSAAISPVGGVTKLGTLMEAWSSLRDRKFCLMPRKWLISWVRNGIHSAFAALSKDAKQTSSTIAIRPAPRSSSAKSTT